MNKKAIKILIVSVIIAVIVGGTIAGIVVVNLDRKKEKLVVYNWADYIDPANITLFEEYYKQKTGKEIEVVYSTFDTNETMMTEVTKGDSQIDLVCPSEYSIQKLKEKNLLQPLDMSDGDYEFISNVYPAIRDRVESIFGAEMNGYFVPYMWGTLGIMYNVEKVRKEDLEAGWGILWNKANNPDLEGKILVKDSVRDVYAATVCYLKEEGKLDETPYAAFSIEQLINTVDNTLLKMCETVLLEQRKHIKGYEVDFGKDDMINKVAYVDLAWSGDAMYAIEESYNPDKTFKNLATGEETNYLLDYFVPTIKIDGEEEEKEFGNVWFDGWAIPKTAQNVPAAKEFINFMCRPDVAMRNMMEIGYSCSFDPDKYIEVEDEFIVEAINCLLENEYVWEISDAKIKELYPKGDEIIKEIDNDKYVKRKKSEDGFDCIIKEIDGVKYDLTEFFGDNRRYPDFKKSEGTLGVMQDFGAQNDAVVSMWERVKGGDEFPWKLIVAIVACVAIVAGAFGLCFLVRHVKSKRQPHIDADSEQQTA